MGADASLEELVHGVKSRCAALMDAAERLRSASPEERGELLALMLPRAERVVELLKEYARR